jgi:predicted metal-dependent hydrolase
MEYLYGIDLLNFSYWWECHEVFEGLWHAVGEDTEQGNCFQALIQLAAAHLKRFLGNEQAAQNLARRALERLWALPHHYMGIDITGLSGLVRDDLARPGQARLLVKLLNP